MDYNDYLAGKTTTNFWYVGRNALIEKLLKKVVKGNKLKILSVGVGTGDELKILKELGDVYAIDIEKKALDLIPAELCYEKKVADVTKLDYSDEFFDIVVAFDIFEHVQEGTT